MTALSGGVPPALREERKTIRVDVTAEDIAQGHPGDPLACPVARALRRTFDFPIKVTRTKFHGRWFGVATVPATVGGPEAATFRLSRAVGEFTLAFDDMTPVQPFSFRVVR